MPSKTLYVGYLNSGNIGINLADKFPHCAYRAADKIISC